MRVERLQCLYLLHSDRSPVILHPSRLWPEGPIEWPRRHFLKMHLRCRFPMSPHLLPAHLTEIDQLGDPMHLHRHRIQCSRKHRHPLQLNHQSLPQLTPIRRMHPAVTLELPPSCCCRILHPPLPDTRPRSPPAPWLLGPPRMLTAPPMSVDFAVPASSVSSEPAAPLTATRTDHHCDAPGRARCCSAPLLTDTAPVPALVEAPLDTDPHRLPTPFELP